jgi:hypothetical protein
MSWRSTSVEERGRPYHPERQETGKGSASRNSPRQPAHQVLDRATGILRDNLKKPDRGTASPAPAKRSGLPFLLALFSVDVETQPNVRAVVIGSAWRS